jgi:transposase
MARIHHYPSDLSDAEWAILAPLLPAAAAHGRPRTWAFPLILAGLCSHLRGGCAWRMLPCAFPPWQTLSHSCQRWRLDGTWEALNAIPRARARGRQGRDAPPWPASSTARRSRHPGSVGCVATMGRRRSVEASDTGAWLCAGASCGQRCLPPMPRIVLPCPACGMGLPHRSGIGSTSGLLKEIPAREGMDRASVGWDARDRATATDTARSRATDRCQH